MNYYSRPGIVYQPNKDRIPKIKHAACKVMEVTSDEFNSRRRTRNFVLARQIFWHKMRHDYPNISLKSLAGMVGTQRDHSTVIHGIRTIDSLLEVDKGIKSIYRQFESMI